jgi:hypothetical protein
MDRWYGVKCLFEHFGLSKVPEAHAYEERVIVVLAASFDDALGKAKKLSVSYTDGSSIKYMGYCNAYAMDEAVITEGTEVYSVMRETKLAPTAFIDHYYDDGTDKYR